MTERYKILKIISFCAILITVISLLSPLVDPMKTSSGGDKFDKVVIEAANEAENTIDVVVLGDSEAYRSVIPLEMYAKYGFTSYVASSPAQKTFQAYKMLETLLEKQKPKVCVLEPNLLFRDFSLISSLAPKFEKAFPIFKYHNAWKGWIDSDFKQTGGSGGSYKGYRYTREVKPATNLNYMAKTQAKEKISSTNMTYFEKILKLCQKNGIELVVLRTPSTKNWNYAKYEAMQTLTREKNIKYIDLNVGDELKIDWSKDTCDKGDHLNFSGAKKVTEFLGKYLKGNFELPDHRNDKAYDAWGHAVKVYSAAVKGV